VRTWRRLDEASGLTITGALGVDNYKKRCRHCFCLVEGRDEVRDKEGNIKQVLNGEWICDLEGKPCKEIEECQEIINGQS